jgi:hypothetical protein
LLRNVKVATAIRDAQKARAARVGIEQDRVLAELEEMDWNRSIPRGKGNSHRYPFLCKLAIGARTSHDWPNQQGGCEDATGELTGQPATPRGRVGPLRGFAR